MKSIDEQAFNRLALKIDLEESKRDKSDGGVWSDLKTVKVEGINGGGLRRGGVGLFQGDKGTSPDQLRKGHGSGVDVGAFRKGDKEMLTTGLGPVLEGEGHERSTLVLRVTGEVMRRLSGRSR